MKKKHFFVILVLVLVALFLSWLLLGNRLVFYLPKLGGYFCVFLLFIFIVSGVFSNSKNLEEKNF